MMELKEVWNRATKSPVSSFGGTGVGLMFYLITVGTKAPKNRNEWILAVIAIIVGILGILIRDKWFKKPAKPAEPKAP